MPKIAELKSRFAWGFVERRIAAAKVSSLEDRQPVFLLFTPRSGSKHFLGLLESIPGAAFDFEVLGNVSRHVSKMYFGPFWLVARKSLGRWVRRHRRGPHLLRTSYDPPVFSSKDLCLSYLSQCLQAIDSRICAVKLQYEHFEIGGVTVADLHGAFPTAKFVVLYRRSMSRQLISHAMCGVTGETGWSAGRTYVETDRTIRLSNVKIRSYFAAVRAINEEWMKLPVLSEHGAVVCYEDICADPQAAFERSIFPLLGISPTPVIDRRFQKQTNRPIEIIVENHDEVADLLNAPDAFQDYELGLPERADT